MQIGWIIAMAGPGAVAGPERAPAMDVGLGATLRDATPAAALDLGLHAIQQNRFTLRVELSFGSPRRLADLEEDRRAWRVTRSVWRLGATLEPRVRLAAPLSVFGSVGVARLSFQQQGLPVSGSRLTPTVGAGVELGAWRVGVRPVVSMDVARFELEQPDGRRTAWTSLGAGATLYVRFGPDPSKNPSGTGNVDGPAAGDRARSKKCSGVGDPIPTLATFRG